MIAIIPILWDAAEAAKVLDRLNIHIRPGLEATSHGTNPHHHGESIWEHTLEVLAALDRLARSGELDAFHLRDGDLYILRTVALLHDIGKVETHVAVDPKFGYDTFHNHAEASANLAEILLPKDLPEKARICLLIRCHVEALHLIRERIKRGHAPGLKAAAKRLGDDLPLLLAFAMADGAAKPHDRVEAEVLRELYLDYRGLLVAREEQRKAAEVRKAREALNLIRFRPEIAALAETAVPNSPVLLPDLSALFSLLGRDHVDTIKAIRRFLER